MTTIPLPPGWTQRRMRNLLAPLTRPTPLSEKQWEHIVHTLIDAYGWERLHIPPVKAGVRWITPGRKGFPDICAVHPDGLCLVLELKTNAAKFDRPEQRRWMALWQRVAARSCGAVDAFVARPADFDAIITYIAAPAQPGPPSLFDVESSLAPGG